MNLIGTNNHGKISYLNSRKSETKKISPKKKNMTNYTACKVIPHTPSSNLLYIVSFIYFLLNYANGKISTLPTSDDNTTLFPTNSTFSEILREKRNHVYSSEHDIITEAFKLPLFMVVLLVISLVCNLCLYMPFTKKIFYRCCKIQTSDNGLNSV